MPDPRDPFAELKPPLRLSEALNEAARCLFCFDAPCTRACPTHIDVPGFIKKIATGNLRGSARTIFDANVLGASCARVCPTEVLCEGACVLNDLHARPIAIGRLQRHATDWAMSRNVKLWQDRPPAPSRRSVAIVGAGPAGLACAAQLASLGHRIVIFEAASKPGGLNSYGVAEYKMRQEFALKEVEYVLARGVELRLGTRIGVDVSIAQLEREFDVIFLGLGLGQSQTLGIPGEDLSGVVDAVAMIGQLKSHRRDARPPGRRVAVVGGGNTAIDAATQSLRLGAEEVTMIYRRGPDEMSAYRHEQDLARADGVRFLFHTSPVRIFGGARVEGIECVRMQNGMRDPFRPAPQPIVGSEFRFAVDAVVRAVGQRPQLDLIRQIAGLHLERGRLRVDPQTMQTDNPRYFAGGDLANGGKEVVDAVAEGKRAALGIDGWLTAEERAAAAR
jgi:glutamate synthase (NADPH/NADH) small chain